MGKRIIQQARGRGSLTYRVRKSAYKYTLSYPIFEGEAEITSLIHSPGHTAPIMKLNTVEKNPVSFYLPAFDKATVGEKISLGKKEKSVGSITNLKNIPSGTRIYDIERNPGDGGKMIRSGGTSALVSRKQGDKIIITMPSKKEIKLSGECRAVIGVIAGAGVKNKPLITAGKNYYKHKAMGRLWPRVSAVSVNAIDHPFGSGRGKRIKSKTVKRNASPGKRVGHLKPRRTGKK